MLELLGGMLWEQLVKPLADTLQQSISSLSSSSLSSVSNRVSQTLDQEEKEEEEVGG